jgi:hypothetical protein
MVLACCIDNYKNETAANLAWNKSTMAASHKIADHCPCRAGFVSLRIVSRQTHTCHGVAFSFFRFGCVKVKNTVLSGGTTT